jgi:N-acetylglucosamine-6-phosphate deacetylase
MSGRLLSNARIVTEGGVVDGWLHIVDGLIDGFGAGRMPEAGDDLDGAWVVPGFVDVHCHGGGGRSFYSGDVDDVRLAAAAHLRRGTTGTLASIGSAALPTMIAAAQAIATVIEAGDSPNLLGIHFEGPFLSTKRAGAQTTTALLEPNESVFAELMAAAGGHARLMTIAPELPGAIGLIAGHSSELVFALGHSDATAEQFTAATDAGARHVTHLFNALPPFLHRAPGPVARAMLDTRLTTELIADGHHLADDTMRVAIATGGADRIVFVTDAMAATGLGDGSYSFVDRTVDVKDGVAYLKGTTTLAGSTLFLAGAFERAVTTLGVGLLDATLMAAGNASRLMGWQDRGRIAVGARADLVVLDEGFRLAEVIPAF